MRQAGLFFAIAMALAGCGTGGGTPPSAGTSAAQGSGYFTVPDAQRAHLQIVPAHMTDIQSTLHTTATVDWDNDRTSQVITQVNGPITRLTVDTGAHVNAGDPLLYVASPDIAGAVSAYRKAKNRVDQAQRTLDRDRDLLAHKAMAQRDADDAEADYNDAQTDLQTSLQALKILGVSDADLAEAAAQTGAVRAELPLRAPISGTVVQKLVFPGQVLQAGSTLAFVISDVSSVWVQAHVYEKDLAAVRVGDAVDVQSASLPETFHGRVGYIGDLLDPATRTTLVRVVTANPHGWLKKDMFVDVTIHSPKKQQVLVVPTSAILYDEQNFPFVYVDAGHGRFVQRLVRIGAADGDHTEITSGLKAGDPVVSQGSLFLQFASTIGK